jgi:hypothetical protein
MDPPRRGPRLDRTVAANRQPSHLCVVAKGRGTIERATIRRILKAAGLPPVPQRPTSWQTFLQAHWGAIAGADFFTTEVC